MKSADGLAPTSYHYWRTGDRKCEPIEDVVFGGADFTASSCSRFLRGV